MFVQEVCLLFTTRTSEGTTIHMNVFMQEKMLILLSFDGLPCLGKLGVWLCLVGGNSVI